jgi:hypothetical protein
MKLPGWYQDPSEENLERFWNGKHWDKATREIGTTTKEPFAIDERYLGPFLFRMPISRDRLFVTYLILTGFTLLSSLRAELLIDFRREVLILVILMILALLPLFLYLLFLPFLVIRRLIDRRRQLSKPDWSVKDKRSQVRFALIGIAWMFAVPSGFVLLSVEWADTAVDKFVASSQVVNDITRDYYVEVAPLAQAIQGISSGSITPWSAITTVSEVNRNVPPILRNLREACRNVPESGEMMTPEEDAIDKAWDVLRITCDVTPRQYAVALAIYRVQISPNSTQAELRNLVSELRELGESKVAAGRIALSSLEPYLDSKDLETLRLILGEVSE